MDSLETVAKLVRQLNGDINQLINHGFTKIPKRYYQSTGLVFINDSLGVVVKRPYLVSKKRPSHAIPTLELDYPTSSEYLEEADCSCPKTCRDSYRTIFIQPLAKTDEDSKHEAYCRLKGLIQDISELDFASRNCGMYNEQPVLFDW